MSYLKMIIYLGFFFFLFIIISALSGCSTIDQPKNSSWAKAVTTDRSDNPLMLIPIRAVQLNGELGRRIDLTIEKNIFALEDEGVFRKKFLKPFLKVQGKRIYSDQLYGGYIGLGKHLDAVTRLAAYTGDDRLTCLKDEYFGLLIASQDADGFIGWCDGQERMEKLWVLHEASYIIHALLSNAHYFQDADSMQAARKLTQWIINNAAQSKLGIHQVGFPTALVRLYTMTGDERCLDWLRHVGCIMDEPHQSLMLDSSDSRPIVHVYSDLEFSCAQAGLMKHISDPSAYSDHWRVSLKSLFNLGGMHLPGTCTGSGPYGEGWNYRQKGEKYSETCATCYLIRFMHLLMQAQRDSFYGDVMERAIYNGLFAAQDPGGRKLYYHIPFTGPRTVFMADTYCCPNNFRRMISELPEVVYYRDQDGLLINMYERSTVKFEYAQTPIELVQDTDYPSSGKVDMTINLSQPVEFTLSLRIPRWCLQAEVRVNKGQVYHVQGGQFYPIQRTWRKGDTVQLRMPMSWRFVKGRMVQAGRAALMRGPVVFCLNPANLEFLDTPPGGERMQDFDYQRNLILDTSTIGQPQKDESLRPGGLAVQMKAWSTMIPLDWEPDVRLTMKEFPDPCGQVTYFVLENSLNANVTNDGLIYPTVQAPQVKRKPEKGKNEY